MVEARHVLGADPAGLLPDRPGAAAPGECPPLPFPNKPRLAIPFLTSSLRPQTPGVVKENYGSAVGRAELEEGYGGTDMTVLVCKAGYLSEVRACFEKRADGAPGDRVTCPASMLREDSCGDEIKIASFDANAAAAIE